MVYEIDIPVDHINIASYLGDDVQSYQSIRINKLGDVVYLSEDCAFTDETPSFLIPILGTKLKDNYYKLYGNGLVLGSDRFDTDKSVAILKSDLDDLIIWTNKFKPNLKMVFRHDETQH
jgi:hypothetical protein